MKFNNIYPIYLDAVNDFPLAFDLIKPILERANAKQLQTIEYYSPVIHLIARLMTGLF